MTAIPSPSQDSRSKPIASWIIFATAKSLCPVKRIVLAVVSLLTVALAGFSQDWSPTGAPDTHWTWLASSADGSNLVGVAELDGIYTSRNSGVSWTKTSAPAEPWYGVTSSADGSHLVAQATYFEFPPFGNPTGGVIYASMDFGTTWTSTSAPNLPWVGVAASADGRKVVAVAYTHGIYTSADSGTTWTKTGAPTADAWSTVASSADGMKLFAGIDGGGIYISADAGVTWKKTSAPNQPWGAIATSADGGKLIAAPYNGLVFASTNSGGNWYPTLGPIQSWGAVASSADGKRLVAAANDGLIYSSTNAGLTWNPAGAQESWYPVASSADGGSLFVGISGVGNNSPGSIYASHSTVAPTLSIIPSGAGWIVSWTVPSTGFALQQNSDLTASDWIEVPGTPVLNFTNLQFQTILPGTPATAFYRLSQR